MRKLTALFVASTLALGAANLAHAADTTTAGTKARVVDEQVDAFVCQCFAQGGDLRILRKVGGYDAAEGAVFRPELSGKGLQPVAAAGGQNEPEAQPGIAAGKLPPDAGGRAGDPDSFG